MDELNLILSELTGNVRRETLHGRAYIVRPANMIVPGILVGSRGPLYYPPEEVANSPMDWNGMPIVVYHPTTPEGKHVSARQPKILAESGIGTVYASQYSSLLASEAWFDEELTKNYDAKLRQQGKPEIYPRLLKGEAIELSTGLFTSNTPAPAGYKDHRGQPYSGLIARNYKPDHLAILPDQKGACSVTDGCGISVNDRTPSTTGDLTVDRTATINYLTANCDCWKDGAATLNGMTDAQLAKLKQHTDETARNRQAAGILVKMGTDLGLSANTELTVNAMSEAMMAKCRAELEKKTPPTPPTGNNNVTPTEPKRLTLNEWQAVAPPEVLAAYGTWNTVTQREKELLVNRLTQHITDPAVKTILVNDLKTKDVAELTKLLVLVPPPVANNPQTPNGDTAVILNYLGAGAGGGFNNPAIPPQAVDQNDGIGVPTYNWAEIAGQQTKKPA